MKLLIFRSWLCICLTALAWPHGLRGAEALWKEIRRADNVVVYEKNSADGGWVSTRAETVIDAPMASVLIYFTDIEKSRKVTPHCKEKRILHAFSAHDRIEYSRIKIVWPFKERYLIYRGTEIHPAPDQALLIIEPADHVPYEDPERIRGKIKNGRFLFQSADDGNRTRIALESDLHASGWLPSWLLRYAARHWMFDMFRNIRKDMRCQKNAGAGPS